MLANSRHPTVFLGLLNSSANNSYQEKLTLEFEVPFTSERAA